VQNLIKIDSAVAALRMREKMGVRVGFLFTYPSVCLSIYLSIYPFLTMPTGHIFSVMILTLNCPNDVFLQPLVLFGCRDETAPHLGGQIPPPKKRKPFWGRE